MKDLSNWVRRDGREILYGPVQRYDGAWFYVIQDDNYQISCQVDSAGGYLPWGSSAADLVPPKEYGYLYEDTRRTLSHTKEPEVKAKDGHRVFRYELSDPVNTIEKWEPTND